MTANIVAIRPMTEDDIPWVAAQEKRIFSDPWPASAFKDSMRMAQVLNILAIDQYKRPCGYLCAQVVADEIQIHNVAVLPDFRRLGIGSRLLEEAEGFARTHGAVCSILEVRIDNEPAIAMYKHLGYERIGRRRNYYRSPVCDALVLFKIFDDADDDETTDDSLTELEKTDGMVS